MGVYLNPGYRAFQMARNSEIFVDKTEMIQFTNSVISTNQRFLSVSRPRRFGKTMAADIKDGLRDTVVFLMNGGRIRINISTYQNDMTTFHNRDDVLTLLIHLGYLGYDEETREAFIPNEEIADEFKTSTLSDEWIDAFRSFRLSSELLAAIWNGNADKTAELMELAHDRSGQSKELSADT